MKFIYRGKFHITAQAYVGSYLGAPLPTVPVSLTLLSSTAAAASGVAHAVGYDPVDSPANPRNANFTLWASDESSGARDAPDPPFAWREADINDTGANASNPNLIYIANPWSVRYYLGPIYVLRAQNGLYLAVDPSTGTLTATAATADQAVRFFNPAPEAGGIRLVLYRGNPRLLSCTKFFTGGAILSAPNADTAPGSEHPPIVLTDNSMTVARMIAAVQQRGADLTWVAMPGINLAPDIFSYGVDLTNADFTGADFSGAQLASSNFTNVRWDRTTLAGADFFNSALGPNIVFKDCDLSNVLFAFANPTSPTNATSGAVTDWTRAILDGSTLFRTSFATCKLIGVDFRPTRGLDNGAFPNHAGTDFSNARLTGSTFAGCNLRGTIFAGAALEGVDFSDTTLDNLPVTDAGNRSVQPFGATPKFSSDPTQLTKFCRATLAADVIRLDWSNLDLTDAKIQNLAADLTGLKATHLRAWRLNLSGKILKNAVFDDADLIDVDFSRADLTGASFKRAKLSGANFAYATLVGADFSDARLGSDLVTGTDGSPIRAADFSYANLLNAVMDHANLNGCNFSWAHWAGGSAAADNALLQGARFANANLSGLSLRQTGLQDTDFASAILVGSDFSGAHAASAVFTDAHLQGAKFQQSVLNGADFTNAAVALASGVPLFPLDAGLASDLNAGRISTGITAAFKSAGHDLLAGSTLAVVTPGQQWSLANSPTGKPELLGSAYASFTILPGSYGGFFVYGASLWITQVNGANSQTITLPCLATTLDPAGCTVDRETTIWPCGSPSASQGARSWSEMLTARTPITPPACVYSPLYWGCRVPGQ